MVIDALFIIAVGLVLAFAGKRFIWLPIGGAGFILAYRIHRHRCLTAARIAASTC